MEKEIDPGPGYRLLVKGELIINGDEFYARMWEGPDWCPTSDVGQIHTGYGYVTRRRKVDTPAILDGF